MNRWPIKTKKKGYNQGSNIGKSDQQKAGLESQNKPSKFRGQLLLKGKTWGEPVEVEG